MPSQDLQAPQGRLGGLKNSKTIYSDSSLHRDRVGVANLWCSASESCWARGWRPRSSSASPLGSSRQPDAGRQHRDALVFHHPERHNLPRPAAGHLRVGLWLRAQLYTADPHRGEQSSSPGFLATGYATALFIAGASTNSLCVASISRVSHRGRSQRAAPSSPALT